MATGGKTLRLGPFKGGINTASDPTAIADTELAECINFDIDFDGALVSRPPITDEVQGPVAGENLDLLGYFVDANGTNWLIGSTNNAVYYLGSGAWVQITTGFRATAMVQYLDKAWLVAEPGSASNGGSWVPTTVGAAGTFTTIASMPKGGAATIYKDRLYVAAGKMATTNSSRLTFSNNGDPTIWTGTDFVDISPGDGQKLLDIFVVQSNMYLFKNDSTYVFSYDSAPTKGVISNLSKNIGVSDTGCVVQYESYLMVYHEDFVYELIQGTYQKLNTKVEFAADFSLGASYFRATSLSIVGDRLVARYFDKVYVFNLKTRTWSTWESTKVFARFLQEPKASNAVSLRRYVGGAALSATRTVHTMLDGFDAAKSETMSCRIATKIFDFDSPEAFKRLYWWGVDLIGTGIVEGTLVPVIFSFDVQWQDLASTTWADMAMFTWGQPGVAIPIVQDLTDTAGARVRKLIKFEKAIRFRSIYFLVEMETTGTTTTAPVKIFTINPVVNIKQRVPKEIN